MVIDKSKISMHLFSTKNDDGNDDYITAIVCDEETFDVIWTEILKKGLINMLTGKRPDASCLQKIRKSKRIPVIRKTPRTEDLFKALGIETTDKFCGIVRGAHNIPLVTGDEP